MPKSRVKTKKTSIMLLPLPTSATFESLLDIIIAEYTQTTIVPSGTLVSKPFTSDEGFECIMMKPKTLALSHSNCPQNFQEFLSLSVIYNSSRIMTPASAFSWFARSRIRYSCSTLTTAFSLEIIPQLKYLMGLTELYSEAAGCMIQLKQMEIYSVFYIPKKTHSIQLWASTFNIVTQVVENGSHNVLKCRESGIIVDISIGQLLGSMTPLISQNLEEYKSSFPGEIVGFCLTPNADIEQQYSRDCCFSDMSPDKVPERFAKRVIRSFSQNKQYCSNCRGSESIGKQLMKCSRCKVAVYCGKSCQALHWKNQHKAACYSIASI